MNRRLGTRVALGLLVLGAVSTGHASDANAAATFEVNRVGDAADLNTTDNKCDSSAASGKQCTLRAAIQQANATAGADTITFNITSASKVIRPLSELPTISQKLTINGYSQPGSSPNTHATGDNAVIKITLDGSDAVNASSLVVETNGVLIKGLAIVHFDSFALQIRGDNNSVTGSFIGVQANGTSDGSNRTGLFIVDSAATNIGGSTPAARNVIASNDGDAIALIRSPNSAIRGNYIGTDASGAHALGNVAGINVTDSTDVTIGGSSAAAGNVISANEQDGILTQGSSTSTTIQANRIGTSASGSTDLGNGKAGVAILGGSNTVGGSGAAGNAVFFNDIGILVESDPNTVTGNAVEVNDRVGIWVQDDSNTISANALIGNGNTAILVTDGIGNRITGNQMVGNGGLGIDLQGGTHDSFGVTSNDVKDSDTGPNGLQNFPVLTSAVRAGNGVTTVSGSLNSLPNTAFTIEFYAVLAPEPSGHGEGFVPIGSKSLTTNSNGDKTFTFATGQLVPSQQVAATAVQTSNGNTSEFSGNVLVIQP